MKGCPFVACRSHPDKLIPEVHPNTFHCSENTATSDDHQYGKSANRSCGKRHSQLHLPSLGIQEGYSTTRQLKLLKKPESLKLSNIGFEPEIAPYRSALYWNYRGL